MSDIRIYNMFMTRKRPDYVKSGLQLWLDGVLNTRPGHDASATGWEDISGHNFDFIPYTTGNLPTIYSNHYAGFTADTFLKCSNATLLGFSDATQAGTLEAVFKHANSGQIIGFRNVNGANTFAKLLIDVGRLIVSGKYGSSGTSRYRSTQNVSAGIHSVSIKYGTSLTSTVLKVNGGEIELEPQTTGWGNNGGDVYVGARVSTASSGINYYPFVSNIYCIRYYNRILTAEEQAHNRRIDIARFGAYHI